MAEETNQADVQSTDLTDKKTGTLCMKTLDRVTVSNGGTITIPCLYENKDELHSKNWCKGKAWLTCKTIARANHTGKWTITDFPADNSFTVTLNKAKSSNSGYYWCASESDRKSLYLTVQEAPDVSVMNSSVFGHEGGNVRVQCFYSSAYQNETKQWCRMKDQKCFAEEKTDTSQNPPVQISDDGESSFTVLMTGLRLSDSGWYYCSVGDLQVPVQLTVTKTKAEMYVASQSVIEENM
ncbi:polymeric immunoglobulin receptor-like [Danio aesculapii]|uniref:polymeric immunoglobulin receptor-like n=1 Tax=Danio aesculapii TaxID=1142201 RepID=UPI0024BFB406|nr:polymeric immunoglobulin receptor-like [Danio aesculapii]